MLGAVLLGGEELLRRPVARCDRAGDRVQARPGALELHVCLGRGADERDVAELEQKQVRRRVDPPESAVERDRGSLRPPHRALREDDLEGVAGPDVLLRDEYAPLVLGLIGSPLGRVAPERAVRRLRDRTGQDPGDLVRVAGEHLRRACHVVDADQRVGDDEAALGQVGPRVRQPHGRLELGDVVVAEVADHGLRDALRLLERDDSPAAADERVPSEPPLLDRLEQEARRPGAAQSEIRPEGSDEIGRDCSGRVHGLQTKRPSVRKVWRAKRVRGRLRRRSRHARGATRPTTCRTGESSSPAYASVAAPVKENPIRARVRQRGRSGRSRAHCRGSLLRSRCRGWREVVEQAMPPAASTGSPALEHVLEQGEIGPCERSVARRARDEEAQHARIRAGAGELGGRHRRRPRPPVDDDRPVARIHCDDEAVAEPCGRYVEELRRQCGRPDHDPGGPGLHGLLDLLDGAVAAAHLHGHGAAAVATRRQALRRRAAEGPVEVDEMEVARALGGEARRRLDGSPPSIVTRSRSLPPAGRSVPRGRPGRGRTSRRSSSLTVLAC